MGGKNKVRYGMVHKNKFQGKNEHPTLPDATDLSELLYAKELLDTYNVQDGDTVVMLGTSIDIPLHNEVLRRNANLVMVELSQDFIDNARTVLSKTFPEATGYRRVECMDFSKLEVQEPVKLVYLPAVIDDPHVVNREGIIRKACELTQHGGYIVSTFDITTTTYKKSDFEETATKQGFNLEYLGSPYFGEHSVRTYAWRCTRK